MDDRFLQQDAGPLDVRQVGRHHFTASNLPGMNRP
jgi:hypothetical protein